VQERKEDKIQEQEKEKEDEQEEGKPLVNIYDLDMNTATA
jgi:hypothetical protein